ncbi:MAG: glycosyltransferase [Fimbriimonadaceae bacterium]|nr:glycosyltransferase [Fimbriimonadaceae bacterium]
MLIPGRHLHLSPSTVLNASRMLKVSESLVRHGFAEQVVLVGLAGPGLPSEEILDACRRVVRFSPRFYRRLPRGKSPAFFAEWYWAVARYAAGSPIGAVHSNSLFDLPAAIWLKLRHGCPVVYDAHELETEQNSLAPSDRIFARLAERFLIRWVDEIVVVSNSIAEWYRRTYSRRVTVVRNKPTKLAATPVSTASLRERLQIAGGMVFLSHGALQNGRAVSILIDAFAQVSLNRHLVFVGFGPLVGQIRAAAQRFPNIHYLEAVPPGQIVSLAATADVGFSLIENTCLSYFYCLPNKLFECEAAGLPVIVSDFPEMAAEVEHWGNGWKVQPSVEAVRDLVNSISIEDIRQRAAASSAAASEASWDKEEPALVEVYSRLAGRRGLESRLRRSDTA